MARGKKHTAEQIMNLLRQVEVGVANGNTLLQACKEAEIVEQTYYRWRRSSAGWKASVSNSFRRGCVHRVNQSWGGWLTRTPE